MALRGMRQGIRIQVDGGEGMIGTPMVYLHQDDLNTIKVDVEDGTIHTTVYVEKWALLKALRDDLGWEVKE